VLSLTDRGYILFYRRNSVLHEDVAGLNRVRVREAVLASMSYISLWYAFATSTLLASPACVILGLFVVQIFQPEAFISSKALIAGSGG
jgi:hypothetical protein